MQGREDVTKIEGGGARSISFIGFELETGSTAAVFK